LAVRSSDAQKEQSRPDLDELESLRAEAEAVLGLQTLPAPKDKATSPKPN
jgi:hypothetical protein